MLQGGRETAARALQAAGDVGEGDFGGIPIVRASAGNRVLIEP
jgi:hypothetical protein